MSSPGPPRLLLLAWVVVASVLATISHQPSSVSHATFKRLRLTERLWQSTQPKESWALEDVSTCGVLCQNLQRDREACKAFVYNKETRGCVTAGNFTVYPADQLEKEGVQVYVRLLPDATVPFAGDHCDFIATFSLS